MFLDRGKPKSKSSLHSRIGTSFSGLFLSSRKATNTILKGKGLDFYVGSCGVVVVVGETCCGTMVLYPVKICHLYWFNKMLISQ